MWQTVGSRGGSESPQGVTMASALLPIEEFPRETDRENVQIIVQSDMLTERVAGVELLRWSSFGTRIRSGLDCLLRLPMRIEEIEPPLA